MSENCNYRVVKGIANMNDEFRLKGFDSWRQKVLDTHDHSRLAEVLRKDAETLYSEGVAFRRNAISPAELQTLLGLSAKTLRALPLRVYRPFRDSTRGYRQVPEYQWPEVLAYLTTLNKSFCDYDPAEGALLAPAHAAEKFGEGLPEFVQLSSRTRRYRAAHKQSNADVNMVDFL